MVPEERLALARRIIERAADYGIPQEDVIIDPIAMTVAADPTCGVITLETMRLIRDQLGNNMTCGSSNVSFGLPDRATVTASFLPLAMHAGLTCAITNPLVPEVRRAVLAGDLLLDHDEYAMRWIASYRAGVAATKAAAERSRENWRSSTSRSTGQRVCHQPPPCSVQRTGSACPSTPPA